MVLNILNEELVHAMKVTGCNSVDEITKERVLYTDEDLLFYRAKL